jgi:2-C-methyl-D-erythritol 4-phosphate cytidylyltransferase
MKDTKKNEKVIAIVPAAGIGKRFGSGTNKSFQNLCAKPVIIWSLQVIESIDGVAEIIPVLKKEDMAHGKEAIDNFGLSKIKRIAPGGKERQDSVYNGLKLIEDKNCVVLIHDGARPLIEKDLIENAIGNTRGFKDFDGIVFGVPVKDTIKEIFRSKTEMKEEIIVKKTLNRNALWAIQTPQFFSYKTIIKAYENAMKEDFYATDDAALLERYGGKIKVIMGSYKNIKITTPEDLEIAEFFLKNKE